MIINGKFGRKRLWPSIMCCTSVFAWKEEDPQSRCPAFLYR